MPNFRIRAAANNTAEVYIYDIIGGDIFGEGITAARLVPELQKITAKTINVRINSPGGVYFDAVTIHNALVRHPATVNTFIDGLAASSASLIAMAGERITIAENAMVMVHEAWAFAVGPAADLRKEADTLDMASEGMAKTYAGRTGQPLAKILDLMKAETWMTADDALELGFATERAPALLEAACAYGQEHALRALGYKHFPAAAAASRKTVPINAPRPQRDLRAASMERARQYLISQ